MEQNYEEKIVALLLQEPNLVIELRNMVPEEYILNGQLRNIYRETLAYYETSDGAVPTTDILLALIEKRHPNSAELFRPLIERTLEAAGPDDVQHVAYYAQALEDAWRTQSLQTNMLDAISALKERKDIDRAVELLQQGAPNSKNKFIQGEIGADLTATLDEIEYRRANPALFEGIPMGFPSLDSATGGHARGELVVVIGGTGVGKSLTLGQIAVSVAKRRKRVLLVTVENNKFSYMNRLYSNIAKVPYYKFKSSQLSTQDKEQWMTAMAGLPEDFFLKVVEFPDGCSARDIWYFMRGLKEPIDYLVVDQLNNMLPNNIREHKPMSWLWYGQIAWDLKILSATAYANKGVPILTAAQAGGGVVGAKELSVDNVAFSKAVLNHAHAGIYITKDEDGQYNMGASKWRDALVRVFPVFPDFQYWRVSEQALNLGENEPHSVPRPATPSPAPKQAPAPSVAPVEALPEGMQRVPRPGQAAPAVLETLKSEEEAF